MSVPHRRVVGIPDWATRAEYQALLLRRLDALEQCTAQFTGGDPLPVAWRTGWSARISFAGRDRDGSLLAHITVTGPQKSEKWLQRVRLVRRDKLNLHLRDGVARGYGHPHTEKR